MKLLWTLLLLLTALHTRAQKTNDTFSVYFDLDVAEINEGVKNYIDSLVYVNKIRNGVKISIIGYADYLNSDEYNLTLSRNRALNVKKYIVSSGIAAKAIKLLVGKGEIKRADTIGKYKGIPKDRRVDIVMEYMPPKTNSGVLRR